MHRRVYPFSAIIGQDALKESLILNAVNPGIGGVLIRGEKGTAKSTAVRSLATLLPRIDAAAGCPFSCHPDRPESSCPHCSNAPTPLETLTRRIRVVNLPLNATEDRVSGGIDFSLALKLGKAVLQPGLLATAHRNILYVDEVNLLDDHIVDIILDAAAWGSNVIEREGISFCHPSRFILVGTMNPEEGELRPQLLDRFGLCVETAAADNPEDRVRLMLRREAFDTDPEKFLAQYEEENRQITRRIESARAHLDDVRMPGHLRGFITELCMENNVAGHRADLVMAEASRALAALEGAVEVTLDHIRKVSHLVLVHRRREATPPPENQKEAPEPQQDASQNEPPANNGHPPEAEEENTPFDTRPDTPEGYQDENKGMEHSSDEALPNPPSLGRGEEKTFDIGIPFKVRPISTPKDRVFRRGSGRRSRTRVSRKQGRYVRSSLRSENGDIALDATLRAAAPHQKSRKNGNGNDMLVCLTKQDIRGKIREKRIGNFLFFVVDASGSMGARGRMTASKGAVMSLLLDAYQKRDKVAMISFRRNEATVNLPPTTSVDLAGKLLSEMPVGGRTPLSAGLTKTFEQLRNVRLKDPSARPIAIFITDGKSNVALGTQTPVEEAIDLATAMARSDRARYIVVDTEEEGPVSFGIARRLARSLGAEYFKIDDLKAESLVGIVKGVPS